MLEVYSRGHHKLNQCRIHDEYSVTWMTVSEATANETPYGYVHRSGHTLIETYVTYLHKRRKHI
jgi:hypothetical protein